MDFTALPMAERIRLLARNYSAEAVVYERAWAQGLRDMGRRLLEHMDFAGCERVLDAGAGVGMLLEDMAELAPGSLVVGADRSEGMIARARPQYGRAVMDAATLGFRSGSFDRVTMAFMLFHLPDPLVGLTETWRVLRPGGRVGTATWGEEETWPAFEMWGEELEAHGADPPQSVLSQHEFVDTPEKMSDLLESAGFEQVKAWSDTLRRPFDLESMIEFASGMAIAKRRFDSLASEARKPFMETATARLRTLAPEDFVLTSEVVLATARRD